MGESAEWAWRTVAQVARAFRVGVVTARDWRIAGMPGRKGHYPVEPILAWVIANRRGGFRDSAAADGKDNGENWLQREKKAMALFRELRLRKEMGELVPADIAAAMQRELARHLVDGLLSAGPRLAHKLANKPVGEIRRTLNEWARELGTELLTQWAEGGADEPASTAKPGRTRKRWRKGST